MRLRTRPNIDTRQLRFREELTALREELHNEQSEHFAAERRIQRACDDAGADVMTQAQLTDFQRHQRALQELNADILLIDEELESSVDRSSIPVGGPGASGLARRRHIAPNESLRDWSRANGAAGGWVGDGPAWSRDAGTVDGHERLSFGRMLRGIVTGEWDDASAERRVMSEGVLADGGYLVPTPLSTEIIDLARAQARVIQAGARTVPMTSSTLKMAKVLSDPEPGWRGENQPIPEDELTFGLSELRSHTLAVIVKSSRELLEDGERSTVRASRSTASTPSREACATPSA